MNSSDPDSAFREEVRGWLAEHLTPEFAAVAGRGGPGDDDGWETRLAWEVELGRGGWIGPGWPLEYGGHGITPAQEIIFHLEYARAGAPARCGHFGESLLAPTLLAHGTEEQKQRFLPAIARAETLWCQGYSEPGAGSDLAAIRTTAVPVHGGWSVAGQKVWTTFAHHAQWIFLLARTEAGTTGHRGISYLLCPLDQPGVDVRPIASVTGAPDFNEVFFTDAFVAAGDVIGAPGDGWRVAMSTLGHERATSVLAYQFSFQQQFDELVSEVRRRRLGAEPGVRTRLADLHVGLEVLRVNNLRSLSGLINDGVLGPEASVIKLVWSRWHQDFCRAAMDILGLDALVLTGDGVGYHATGFHRSFLTSLSETIYAGTTEVQLNIVAERVLGLPRERGSRPAPVSTEQKELAWTSS